MMQHHEQETRQTLPRFLQEPLVAIGNTMRTMQAHGALPEDIVTYATAAIDAQAQADRKRLNASLNALAEAIRNDTGWVGGFAPDQWQQITDAIDAAMTEPTRLMREAGVLRVDLLNVIKADVKARLEQQNGDTPS